MDEFVNEDDSNEIDGYDDNILQQLYGSNSKGNRGMPKYFFCISELTVDPALCNKTIPVKPISLLFVIEFNDDIDQHFKDFIVNQNFSCKH